MIKTLHTWCFFFTFDNNILLYPEISTTSIIMISLIKSIDMAKSPALSKGNTSPWFIYFIISNDIKNRSLYLNTANNNITGFVRVVVWNRNSDPNLKYFFYYLFWIIKTRFNIIIWFSFSRRSDSLRVTTMKNIFFENNWFNPSRIRTCLQETLVSGPNW